MTRLFRNKKGQNVAEYAILIALVIGAIIAMQKFVQRTFQARLKDASKFMVDNTSNFGNTGQYEPYYQASTYTTTKDSREQQFVNGSLSELTSVSDSTREGNQQTIYTASGTTGNGMTID